MAKINVLKKSYNNIVILPSVLKENIKSCFTATVLGIPSTSADVVADRRRTAFDVGRFGMRRTRARASVTIVRPFRCAYLICNIVRRPIKLQTLQSSLESYWTIRQLNRRFMVVHFRRSLIWFLKSWRPIGFDCLTKVGSSFEYHAYLKYVCLKY